MSILVVEPRDRLGEAVVQRLLDDGDEVRVVETDPELAERWRAMGAHVATAGAWDSDLVERACQNVRTLVLMYPPATGAAAEAIEGARLAGTGRIVAWGPRAREIIPLAGAAGLDYVILDTGRARRRSARSRYGPEDAAAAISAAGDLDGEPHLELEVDAAAAWQALGVTPGRPG